MERDIRDMIDAWEVAARELGIVVRRPFQLDEIEFPVLVVDFGSRDGALPLLAGDDERFAVARRAGYFASLLNPERYCVFDRQLFEDTLNDWRWFGEGTAPAWYTGKAWC